MYQLSIITPNGKIFDQEIDSLIAPGAEGFFGVLTKHAPMVSMTNRGVLVVQKSGGTKYFAVSSGILEVNLEGKVLFLSDSAEETQNAEDAKTKSKDLAADYHQKIK